jgi:hypothetical protein
MNHVSPEFGPVLIDAPVKHSYFVLFSAACSGQERGSITSTVSGLVICRGYSMSAGTFAKMKCFGGYGMNEWIEPWHRQNMFVARRDLIRAGKEPRVRAVVHPLIF